VDDIVINPRAIKLNKEDPELIARTLSEILNVDYDKILAKTAKTDSGYQMIARKVEPDVAKKVEEFKEKNKLSGVQIEENTKRYYPYSSLACQVIGFVGTDNEGRAGLENYYDKTLTGVSGTTVHAKNAAGTDMLFTSFEDYYDGQNGESLVTTIDSTIQYYMEKQLEQAVRDYGVKNGAAAIAMNVKTGGILGMVSLDNYDLNNYQTVSEAEQKKIDAMSDDAARQQELSGATRPSTTPTSPAPPSRSSRSPWRSTTAPSSPRTRFTAAAACRWPATRRPATAGRPPATAARRSRRRCSTPATSPSCRSA